MNLAGLIFDDSEHYLDHLAPFCSLLNCPLIICEEHLASLAKKFYPDLDVIQIDPLKLKLPLHSITCDPMPLIQAAFPKERTQTIWLPHGRSDKGAKTNAFEALHGEKIALVYGPSMEMQLKKLKLSTQIIQVGNFRLHYFQKHKKFYEKLVPFLNLENKILYAPSWDDQENSSSFWKAFPSIAKNLPSDLNLLLKFHPNTMKRFEPEIEVILSRFSNKNIHVLPQFPPIYPLIHQMSAYIGDMSSIGYDYLLMKGPMFFLNRNIHLPLHKCGESLDLKTFTFSLEETTLFERKKLYDETFKREVNYEELQKELFCALSL